jgi:DNA-binding NtrC family response regulator
MQPERRATLLQALRVLDIETLAVSTCAEARSLFQISPGVELVLTEVSLHDGNWSDVLRHLVDNGIEASVVVSSQRPDEHLFSEVIWRGGYDVLVEPYEKAEVRQILEGALRAAQRNALVNQSMRASN